MTPTHLLLGVTFAMAIPTTAGLQGAAQAEGDLLLLAATRTSTIAKELDDAASRSYRVISAAGGPDFNELVVVLEPSAERYQYRLVSTERTSTLERELNDAAQGGYRVVPRAITIKRNASVFSPNNNELLVIMEKPSAAGPAVRYQVLATSRTGTLQGELRQAQVNGWHLVTLVVRGEVLAILDRAAD